MIFGIVLFILAFLATVIIPQAVPIPDNYNKWSAAKCVSESVNCTEYPAKLSGFCVARTRATDQPARCLKLACEFCKWDSRQNHKLCASSVFRTVCASRDHVENSSPEPYSIPIATAQSFPTPSGDYIEFTPVAVSAGHKKPKFSKPLRNCIWSSNLKGGYVIDLGKFSPLAGWKPSSRDGFQGLVYRPNKNGGIDGPKHFGNICAQLKVHKPGTYYFSVLSYAKHFTEHNDAWFKCSKGFSLWRNGKFWKRSSPGEWLKGYQNNGRRSMSTELKTKDFEGHRFLVETNNEEERVEICISGRSYQFELYRLYLLPCQKQVCIGERITGIEDLPISQCVFNDES